MAGVASDHSSGNLDVELNLVPFIDLLSTLTLFLLITAVWVQVGVIPAAVSGKGASSNSPPPVPQQVLTIQVSGAGVELKWPDGAGGMPTVFRRLASPDEANRLIKVIQSGRQAKRFTSLAVQASDQVEYAAVIDTLDVARRAAVGAVGLSLE